MADLSLHVPVEPCVARAQSYCELPTVTQQVSHRICVELRSPPFVLNPQVLVLPWDSFRVSLLLPVSAPERSIFSTYFLTWLLFRTVVHLSNALCVFTPATFLLDDSILKGKRESEKERKLHRAVNLGFWPFFLKTGCCPLSVLNLHVLRMRNKSSHDTQWLAV